MEGSKGASGCFTVGIYAMAIRQQPSDLPPLLKKDALTWATLEIMGLQLAGLCHIYPDGEADAALEHLLTTINEGFDKARDVAKTINKLFPPKDPQ